jgi:copper chaperone NosL
LLACEAPEQLEAARTLEPEALADQEGGVCGMLVRDQPAPRAQVVHRDGSRFFFCSLGDLMVHRTSPSPHGRVVEVFVEVMEPQEDPALGHTAPHPWAAASEAFYVVGVERTGIMGRPVLAYADRAVADTVASRYPGARVMDFAGLEVWWHEGLQ